MIVVGDTTPLNYLIPIGQHEGLLKLYGKIIIPQAVYEELTDPSTPKDVTKVVAQQIEWIEVKHASTIIALPRLDRG